MDRYQTNLEILRVTREIVMNEHADIRADLHNTWLYESDVLWRKEKLRLAYPTIPPYPTENDIVERAKILIDFMINYDPKPIQPVIESQSGSSIDMPENVVLPFKKTPVEAPIEPKIKLVPDIEPDPEPIEVKVEEPEIEPVIDTEPELVEEIPKESPPIPPVFTIPVPPTRLPTRYPIRQLPPEPIVLPEPTVEKVIEPTVDAVTKESAPTVDTTITGKILPSVRKKIEDIRNDWTKK